MRAAHRAVAAGLAVVVGTGLLAGCRTGESTEPADEPTAAPTEEPAATAEPTVEPTPTDTPEVAAEPAVNGPNSITAPTAGAEVPGPTVTVTGEGTGFEGTLAYRVTRAGEVVAEGYTTAGANGEVGPYSFDVALDPGEYTLQVWEPGMGEGDSDGDARNRVEVSFTVS
ncbi:Gmad2 immunoglobulin-like domain-containing protein [Actinotalea fermentans]|uniref:Bacterial spore germination immunoglobulin-like domain-containing protein n=1 Tax=Actinotalea fermentans TaxID=43671 RepID=A0A511YTM9_9CELL|nr:Gmad2 immunoglobulin-like domain-containing protein [Actinotalea fermentans]KGM17210.1 hypothetical protein N867_08130 [Actinotalea fermentans ATCC 43279 = JCM 9966 = DSM 3133]GEN78550.1 hypothetical protein AFE02nite_02840 [Actinotalea fermentans]